MKQTKIKIIFHDNASDNEIIENKVNLFTQGKDIVNIKYIDRSGFSSLILIVYQE